MEVNVPPNFHAIADLFLVPGRLIDVQSHAGGHINASYRLTFALPEGDRRFLLQRINATVLPNPEHVMENIQRVTRHLTRRLQDQRVRDLGRRVLTLVETHSGRMFAHDDTGTCWRIYEFIEGARVVQACASPRQAEQAGRAYGTFQSLLADLGGPKLHEILPDFHHTPRRLEALEKAVAADRYGRVAAARREIDFARAHRTQAGRLVALHEAGEIAERIVHNDAKMSNVLLDEVTGDWLCVTDLDTIMPGLALYDFGDMVRSMTCPAAEDERDLDKVELQMPLFEALARGYLATAAALLAPAERDNLVFAGKLITLEQGVRFLTDFLGGDTYYKTDRPDHNLARCRTQFKLVESIERHESEMAELVRRL